MEAACSMSAPRATSRFAIRIVGEEEVLVVTPNPIWGDSSAVYPGAALPNMVQRAGRQAA
jgi:hypothetical protein